MATIHTTERAERTAACEAAMAGGLWYVEVFHKDNPFRGEREEGWEQVSTLGPYHSEQTAVNVSTMIEGNADREETGTYCRPVQRGADYV